MDDKELGEEQEEGEGFSGRECPTEAEGFPQDTWSGETGGREGGSCRLDSESHVRFWSKGGM